MKKQLTVLLGAGFSANAGMPTAKNIAERFDRDLKDKLISFFSGEWAWTDDKTEADLRNGRLNFDYLGYSYVFDEFVKSYVSERGSFVYYEDFYQYLIDRYDNPEWIGELFERAKNSLIADRPYLTNDDYLKNYLFAFDKKQFRKVSDIINYLIADILITIPKTDEELLTIYANFISYLKTFEEVDIFTLNHDVLLERMFDLNEIEYSKGFNTASSPIHSNGVPVPYFNNEFNKPIRIYKLHGSLDFYQFRHFQQEGIMWKPTSKYDYFATTNYDIKHNTVLIDPNTLKIIQDYNFDIVPKFITGTDKTQIIHNDRLYSALFETFERVMKATENIFISGYSFSDIHINNFLQAKKYNYINHYRSQEYPYDGTGRNIKSFDDLS